MMKSFPAALVAAALAGCGQGSADLALAIPFHRRASCEAPNARELQIMETAASAIELDEAGISNWLTLGAKKLLGHGLTREKAGSSVHVCTPESILARVGRALNKGNGLGAGQLVEYQLELVAQLPNPSDAVIEQVGQAAFSETRQISETLPRRDIRPYARTVLAEFGKRAERFRDRAARDMSRRDALRTGAAQVAAAAGDPTALPRIVGMFNDRLDGVPQDQAIPLETRDRLIELAWAIHYAGEAGRGATAPIHSLMRRKVESRAPPFGIVELSPKRVCRVLRAIEGDDSTKPYPFCNDSSVPFDQ